MANTFKNKTFKDLALKSKSTMGYFYGFKLHIVVNDKGELVGIMSGIFTKQSDTNVGVNFAISSELLLKTTNHLLK